MNKEDYNKYYIQGSDHYLIPKDVFKELFNEMENWKEEVKELKKQLEEYENEPLTNKISRIDCVVSNIYSRNKTQKKEFIEYLEKTIKELECDDFDDEEMKGYLIQRIDTFKEILKKYKSIIGDK